MGIGNSQRAQVRLYDLTNLITPHGDWKLFHLLGDVNDKNHSLPLMGIGNP